MALKKFLFDTDTLVMEHFSRAKKHFINTPTGILQKHSAQAFGEEALFLLHRTTFRFSHIAKRI